MFEYLRKAVLTVLFSSLVLGGVFPFGFTNSLVPAASAAIPNIINYQSRLRSSSLAPITALTSIQFTLYTDISAGTPGGVASSAGPVLWKEVHDGITCSQILPDADGYFSVQLGACTVFPSYISWNQPLYLGVKIAADAEASPRVLLGAHQYALNSQAVNGFTASTTAQANTILALDANQNFNIATGTFMGAGLTITASSSLQDLTFVHATGTSLDLANYLSIGAIRLDQIGTTNLTSGAYLVGVFDEFANSNATTVQAALRDFDIAITAVSSTSNPTSTLQRAYDGGGIGFGNTISLTTSTPIQIRTTVPGISSSQNGITITRSDSPNQGVVIGTTNYGSNFSHFGMSDNISNITGASGVFAFYNHNQNNFGFSLLGQSGAAKSVFTLTNADLGNKAAFEIENQSTINSTGILRLRNIPDSANVELHVGTSSPEGIITSDISSIFFQRDGTASGTQLYIKTQDGNNQGWVGVATVDMLGNINQANNGLSVSGTEVILGGTLYQSTVIDGNGGANDFTLQDVKNFSLGGGGAGAVGDMANTLLRLTGTDEFQIRTPNFLLATTGSVLTLIDPATGKVEFATATANEVDTLQTVTNRGNSTTNTIQFAGGTSTNSFSISSGQLAVNTTTYRNVANFVGNDILGTYISVQNLNTSADDTGLRVFNELNQQVARFGYYLGGDIGFALSDIGDFQVGSVDVAGDIDFYAGAALRGRFTNLGRLGIGTVTPSSRLHVVATSSAIGAIQTLQNSIGDIQFFVSTGTPNGFITGSAGDISFGTDGKLYIKETGTSTNTGWSVIATGTQSGLAVQGSGSAGQIVLWNGTSSVTGNSLFTYSTSSGSVKIGTGTPSVSGQQFTLMNTNAAGMVIESTTGTGISYLELRHSSGATSDYQVDSSGAFIGSTSNDPFYLTTNNNARLYITPVGQIGIGTNTPSAQLDVYSAATATFPLLTLENSDGNFQIFNASTTPEGLITGSRGDLAIDSTNGRMYIKQSGTSTNTGWVAFATGTPAELDTLQTVTNRGNQTTTTIQFAGGTSTGAFAVQSTSTMQDIVPAGLYTGNMSAFNLGTSSTRWNSLWAGTVNIGTSTWSLTQSSNGRFSVFNQPSGDGTEVISVQTDGKVGIGNTSPTNRLSVGNGTTGIERVDINGLNQAILEFKQADSSKWMLSSGDIANSFGIYSYGFGYKLVVGQTGNITFGGENVNPLSTTGKSVTISGDLNERASLFVRTTEQDNAGSMAALGFLAEANTAAANEQMARIEMLTVGSTLNNRGSQLGFYTKPDGGAMTLAATIDSSGRLIVGTSTVSAKFTVYQSSTSTALAQFGNSASDFQVFSISSSPESVLTGSIGDIAIDSTNGRMYIKQTGASSNTGWIAFSTSTSSGTDTLQTVTNRGNSTTNTIQFAGGTSTGVFTLSKSLIEGGGNLEPQLMFKDATSTSGLVIGRYSTGVDENYTTLAFSADTSLNPYYATSVIFDYSHLNNNMLMRSYGGGIFKNGMSIGDVINFESGLNHGIGVTSAYNFINYGSLKGIMSFSNPQASMDFFMSTGSPVGVISGNSGSLYFQTDAPSTSTAHLFLKTADSSSAGWKPVAILDSNGNLGIGTSTPALPLHVYSAATSGSIARFTNTDGSCDIDPTNSALVCSSDANLKKNVLKVEGSLEKIMALRGVLFNWSKEDDTDEMHSGFIAQEVQAVLPGLVMQGQDGKLAVNYTGFAPYLVGALQEQQNAIQSLQKSMGSNDLQSAATTTFNNNLVLTAQLIASGDMVGQARIKAHQTAVSVRFSKPYTVQPIIVVTPRGEMALAQNFKYAVVEEKNSGFTIKIDMERDADIDFNWHAIGAGEGSALTVSDGTSSTIQLIVGDAPVAPTINQSSQSGPTTPTPEPISPQESFMTQPQTESLSPVEMQQIEQMPSSSIETQQDTSPPVTPIETVQVQ